MTDRIVVLIDMDCFYCQVEEREDPNRLAGNPAAVVQYNTWKGGGIIAVNYEARAFGVTRNMRGDEAKEKCPDILLVSVPESREKADLTKYREAGKEVIQVLLGFDAVVERASVDEAYLDVTKLVEDRLKLISSQVDSCLLPNTHVVGHAKSDVPAWLKRIWTENCSDDIRLAVGAIIVEEMRLAVLKQTKFRCSAGIAHNKMLAKLACGINKPNQQTVLPHSEVPGLFETLKVTKLRGLGGKLGHIIREDFGVETVADLSKLSPAELRQRFEEKTAFWLHGIARGLEHEPVKERDLPKSIGCSKNFLGPKMLDTREKIEHWFGQLAEEVVERLEKDRETNGRVARGLVVSVTMDNERGHVSRTAALRAYDKDQIQRQAVALIGGLNSAAKDSSGLWTPKLKNLSISATKFEDEHGKGNRLINDMFAARQDDSSSSEAALLQAQELVPDLDNYDESLLEFLPSKVRAQVVKRVEELRASSSSGRQSEGDRGKRQSFFSRAKSDPASDSTQETGSASGSEKSAEPGNSADASPCPKCSQVISAFDLPEHLDYHMAKELQRKLAKEQPSDTAQITSKRKLESKETKGSSQLKKQKNITSFFQKK